ncbi:hypothetical protein HPL003_11290 [Paenibacillus terrae HPL-003]|uniref:Spo0E family sporulation regulatory protein-aspartic acid phosphatase n=1 Tax=Paenibacillus terrae (strain HPL-003) TaxID=985665 RepID=G7VYM5_PAETH|nr:aspartyl-phosphate phosphatase Spo0E family protein [Paenibacillus terrae]AET59015.1 hypothetical protein HPL003_11290 [Paenibacillus terrae HPL-003]
MEEKELLKLRLENARQKLYDLQAKYGLEHALVLNQSMILDELINQYNRTFYRRVKKPPA